MKNNEALDSEKTIRTHLNEHEAAQWLGRSVHTLRKWRQERKGPRFMKMNGALRDGRGRGGHVAYRLADLERFMESLEVQTTVSGAEVVSE